MALTLSLYFKKNQHLFIYNFYSVTSVDISVGGQHEWLFPVISGPKQQLATQWT